MPCQKLGIAMPSRLAPDTRRSSQEFWRYAARTPAGTAMQRDTSAPRPVSTKVRGSLSAIMPAMGRLRRIELPMLPLSMFFSHVKYWTWTGWSRPYSACSRAMATGSGSVPNMIVIGSPGIRCTIANEMTETPSKVGIASNSLWSTYLHT